MTAADIVLTPVTGQDFAVLRDLARAIWLQHYTGITSATQIEYMLARRFSDEALRDHLQAADRWLHLLRVSGEAVGYCGYQLTDTTVDDFGPDAMKLGQLYVLESHRGMGLGRLMLGHVEGRSRDLGRRTLWLQVNKKNTIAIRFYEAMGFKVVRKAVFDIGGGFVMDDYVMAKECDG